jgi:hypothetical protein
MLLNKNRWNLDIEATLCSQRQRQAMLRIFISEHKWTEGQPTEEEATGIAVQALQGSPLYQFSDVERRLRLVLVKNCLLG